MKATYIALALLFTGGAQAQSTLQHNEQPKGFTSYDSLTCGEFMSDSTGGFYSAVAANYIRGYLTGYNQFSGKHQIQISLPNNTVSLWLQKYCRDNPLSTITLAAITLRTELTANAQQKK